MIAVVESGTGGVLFRSGLFARLSSRTRVTVVTAPAGSGKTVLLRSWISRAGLDEQAGWVSAGPDERDPRRLWPSVAGALRNRGGFGAGAAGNRSPRPGRLGVVERLLTNLAALREPIWLVIDDVHELGPEVLRAAGAAVRAGGTA
jgi:LuxR family maltose regulon positive regulatory protein